MDGPEIAALVALLRQTDRPWPVVCDLLERGHSAADLLDRELSESTSGQQNLIGGDSTALIERATVDLDRWRQANVAVVTVLDPGYPVNLRAVHDRPPILFVAGELVPEDRMSIAVVGSRRATPAGLERAEALARHLVNAGYTVVSGLAAGIDAAAHRAALGARGRTVAVIGTGLEHSYPAQNAALQNDVATQAAVLSPFWPETPPSRDTFPMRNAVMSGLTLGTAIVEATVTSGARIQARRALAHGRPVFLDATLLSQDWARELAQRPAVHVISDPREITDVVAAATTDGALAP